MTSIISSLYKSDRYLKRFQKALSSFALGLQKTGIDFELIIIANEPTEAEKQFADGFKQKPWFRFFEVPREPLYASWNRGVKMAEGDIVGFWNVDDVRYSEAISEALGLIAQGAELVYFPFLIKRYLKFGRWYLPLPSQKIDKQVLEFSSSTRKEFQRSMICGPFFVFTKLLYQKVGPFDEQFKIAGDFDWCARAAKISDKFARAKSLGGEFRVDGGGLSSGDSARHVAENNIVYIRQHVWEKLAVAEDLMIKEYSPKYLLFEKKSMMFKD